MEAELPATRRELSTVRKIKQLCGKKSPPVKDKNGNSISTQVFCRILLMRIDSAIDSKMIDEQAGYRKGRGINRPDFSSLESFKHS